MKKLLNSSTASKLSVFGLTLVLAATSAFAQAPGLVGVHGRVTDENGGVAGATVEVICGDQSETTTTNGGGNYQVELTESATCTDGTEVVVNASKDGKSGSNGGTIGEPNNKAQVDVFISANEVPEFGLITGSLAALASAGSYLTLKKRSKKA